MTTIHNHEYYRPTYLHPIYNNIMIMSVRI